jgi:hypothetical protein
MSHRDVQPLGALEWMPPVQSSGMASSLRIAWAVPVLVCGGIGWALAGPPWGAAAAAAAAVVLWAWIRLQGRLMLRALHAVPLRPEQAPRLFNIAGGLAGRGYGGVPAIWLIPDGGPNAVVCWAGGACIAITKSLLDGYTRTELEAVVAHCFIRLSKAVVLSEAFALGRLGITVTPLDALWVDAATAALTRYPPALASAITKAHPRSDRFAPAWFVSATSGRSSPSARAEMLQEL